MFIKCKQEGKPFKLLQQTGTKLIKGYIFATLQSTKIKQKEKMRKGTAL